MMWSYRDLVFARLLGWLRVLGMPLDVASARVQWLRERLPTLSDESINLVKADGRSLLLVDSLVLK